mmetsp:Transcript_28211/g.65230  ORF Transcript_28211/g.65230 Transcript_28211/m.65230 type:complete len:250 (-) Transcript_28211:75-824(-)
MRPNNSLVGSTVKLASRFQHLFISKLHGFSEVACCIGHHHNTDTYNDGNVEAKVEMLIGIHCIIVQLVEDSLCAGNVTSNGNDIKYECHFPPQRRPRELARREHEGPPHANDHDHNSMSIEKSKRIAYIHHGIVYLAFLLVLYADGREAAVDKAQSAHCCTCILCNEVVVSGSETFDSKEPVISRHWVQHYTVSVAPPVWKNERKSLSNCQDTAEDHDDHTGGSVLTSLQCFLASGNSVGYIRRRDNPC